MIDCSRVTKLITHDSCADGLASAMIVRDALPSVEVVFAQYGTPSLEELEPVPGLLFCDITPPRARAQAFVDAGAIVLDHHKHARDIVELFGDHGVFADELAAPGVSGALLAYAHVWVSTRQAESREVETFAMLAGVRDTWQQASPYWVLANDLHATLMGLPRAWWLNGGIAVAMAPSTLELGRLWRAKHAETVKQVCASGRLVLYDPEGRPWAVFPDSARLTSDVAEAMRARGVPITCGWFQQVEGGVLRTVLSLRSDGSLDVGELCKRLGGGGHSRAADCRLALENPLRAVLRLQEEAALLRLEREGGRQSSEGGA